MRASTVLLLSLAPSLAALRLPFASSGRFVSVPGFSVPNLDGATETLPAEAPTHAAAAAIKAAPDEFWGYLTVDDDPEMYPKVLCRAGFSPRRATANSQQPCTAHFFRSADALPLSGDIELHDDGISLDLKRADTPDVRRPGRCEGLGDEYGATLKLVDPKMSAQNLRQGDLGNCWLVSPEPITITAHGSPVLSVATAHRADRCTVRAARSRRWPPSPTSARPRSWR